MTGEGGHILEIGDGGAYLDRSPVAGLTLLAHDNLGKLFLAFADAFCHLQQIAGTLDGGRFGPRLLGSARCVEGTVNIVDGAFGLTGNDFFGRGV